MHLRPAFLNVVLVLSLFAEASFAQTVSPLGFVQRRDVGQQINLQPQQREIIQRIEPICDAQCQARVMDMIMNAPAELQSQFLAQSPEERAQTAAGLTRAEQENIETEMLSDNVLDEQQMRRFHELRTQFLGNDSFLSDRVSSLLGLSDDQIAQLRTIQDAGTGLINACQSIPGLSVGEQQQGITLIQNNLIDQSINILNGAQIEIFVNLCGERCEFDLPGEPVLPMDSEALPDESNGGEESTSTGPEEVRSGGSVGGAVEGSGLRTVVPVQSSSNLESNTVGLANSPQPHRSISQAAPVERSGTGSSTQANSNASPSQGASTVTSNDYE